MPTDAIAGTLNLLYTVIFFIAGLIVFTLFVQWAAGDFFRSRGMDRRSAYYLSRVISLITYCASAWFVVPKLLKI